MAFITTEKFLSKEWIKSYSFIVLGSFILALAFVLFVNPYKLVPGGVFGIGIVVHHLTTDLFSFWPDGIPIGLFGLVLNIPLTIIGVKILGPRFGVKTVVGFLLTSVFMDTLTYFIGEQDPLGLEGQTLLAVIFGGALAGLGLGLIFKSRATSGGSDIIAMIFAKFTGLPPGQLLIAVDSVIVILGLLVFKDWKVPLYSWLMIFITGKVIDITMQGLHYEKALIIISQKSELIRDKIINDLKRGGTIINSSGMYNDKPVDMIYTVVNRRELEILKSYIRGVDSSAFLTVVDANEILGNGFKSLNE